ncbi:ABC transporter substrate-binding protein [Microbacterium sp. CSI-V]|uniref:glutamate ABC transporter substrate-binding protein n=1 Tax=unclassified Microbacterium TaxID=2609290 RepID=UPI00097C7367|nr:MULTISPECIES: glutamate ABC transporter substrate-binding protein [unclassified Microbacterium]MXS74674.1 glutamate ABC transporter substrate-binding protein [Microbacterium sp. TL13]ONI65469.1 ABC transporter substrate-binding protein [Microbacterium sp. CSI-V]
MRKSRLLAGVGVIAAGLLALTACNSGTPGSPDAGSGEGSSDAPVWGEVASNVTIDGSPTFEKISSAGKVVIGVKEDQPGLGYLDPVTGERKGFDVDIARWIAASLGYDPADESKVEYKAIASANREQALINGDIDYYVGTYSITDKRKEQISFAGPYFLTGQGLLVAADNDTITGKDSLTADTTVCSVTGSTPIQRIREETPAKVVEFDTYSQCVEKLKNGEVDAVTTDEAILLGYAAQDPDNLKIAGEPFSEERYGVGLAKGDTSFQEFVNTLFTDGGSTWQAIFEKNLGASGVEGKQPAVDAAG